MQRQTLSIKGMFCPNCEGVIARELRAQAGIVRVSVSYAMGTAEIEFDEAVIDLTTISGIISELGYAVDLGNRSAKGSLQTFAKIIGYLLAIIAVTSLLRAFSTSSIATSFPIAQAGMSWGTIFIVGLLTSAHCIAMCGGINLSQTVQRSNQPPIESAQSPVATPQKKVVGRKYPVAGIKCVDKNGDRSSVFGIRDNGAETPNIEYQTPNTEHRTPKLRHLLLPSLLYNLGRIVSYTAVGVVVGSIGSIITVSDYFQHTILILAGLFMLIMGINMLGGFPLLRKIRFSFQSSAFGARDRDLSPTPSIDGETTILSIQHTKTSNRKPFIIGILNGFIPCGPLQAMQLYALSTGSPITGGIAMFLFALGTVPLMFALGAAGSILSGVKGKAFSNKIMKAGAVLIAAMGLMMFINGAKAMGVGEYFYFGNAKGAFRPVIENGVQIVRSELSSNQYPAITVLQGVPVRWIITATEDNINGCNNRFILREYGIEYTFSVGDNVIEFMPSKAGRFNYSCWMYMIHGSITVVSEDSGRLQTIDYISHPAGVFITSEKVAIAQIVEGNDFSPIQTVEIELNDNGFEPAIIIVYKEIPLHWTIDITSLDTGNLGILCATLNTKYQTVFGKNVLTLIPTKDFDFSTLDHIFYGYVKVVEDMTNLDIENIKDEIYHHETLIYPDEVYNQ